MAILPDFSRATFLPGGTITNPYFPLDPGRIQSSPGFDTDPDTGVVFDTRDDFWATGQTVTINGVDCQIVRDTAVENGRVAEDTIDFFAQDTDGNVWYFGEHVIDYNYDKHGNFVGTDSGGEWIASDPGNAPGYIMTAKGHFGPAYYNEFAPGVAEDESLVVGRDLTIDAGGITYDHVRKTADSTALDSRDFEFKYFAPGYGQVFAQRLGLTGKVLEESALRLDTMVGTDDPSDAGEKPYKLAAIAEGKTVNDIANVRDVVPADLTADEDKDLSVQLLTQPEGSDRFGWYKVDEATGRIGKAHLFAVGEDSADIKLGADKALGLFLIADTQAAGIDVDAATKDGFTLENLQTGHRAHLGDAMPPVVTDADGNFLPLQLINLLGANDGGNVLNPGGGVGGIELSSGVAKAADADLFGFERSNAMDAAWDGDFNDLFVSVSDTPLTQQQVHDLQHEIAGHVDPVLLA